MNTYIYKIKIYGHAYVIYSYILFYFSHYVAYLKTKGLTALKVNVKHTSHPACILSTIKTHTVKDILLNLINKTDHCNFKDIIY